MLAAIVVLIAFGLFALITLAAIFVYESELVVVRCAWCGRVIRWSEPIGGENGYESHGICQNCVEKFQKDQS